MKRRAWFLMVTVVFALSIAMVCPFAEAAAKAKGLSLSQTSGTIDMAVSKTLQLSATVTPSTASQSVEWKSSNTKIASVSKTGLVTAKKAGKVTIYARPKNVNKVVKCNLVITDSKKPSSIAVSKGSVSLAIGETITLTASVNPSTADQTVKWESAKKSIATVSSDGTITGIKSGTAQIRVKSATHPSVSRVISVKVTKKPAPTQIVLTPDTKVLNVGDKLTLTASAVPDTASASVSYRSSNTKVATVTSGGVVTALKAGTVKITATSKEKSSVKTVCTLTVTDSKKVTGVSITQKDMYLGQNDTVVLRAEIKPAGATSAVTWSSSDNSVAKVASDGKLTALKSGEAVIQVKTEIGNYTASVKVTVLDTSRTMSLPLQTSTVSQITENLAKIDAIRLSTNNEINSLIAKKTITEAEGERRKKAIINAFAMYRFPWMTESSQPYWYTSAADKAYKTGVVYYGMPYIQHGKNGNYTNRRYNAALAIAGGYFKSSGKGYYLMNQSKKIGDMYVGSDCSSFVSMSIWGTSHPASYLNTTAIRSSTYYKTITTSDTMRPGDILVKGSVHTVMFLYYTNDAKTQMMIIEQGGGTEPNTVACRVKNVFSYTANGYIIRRPISF